MVLGLILILDYCLDAVFHVLPISVQVPSGFIFLPLFKKCAKLLLLVNEFVNVCAW